MGVHAKGKRPHVGNAGMGEPYNPNIYRTMRLLSERLRYVRVVCGDWTRVCGGSWQTGMGVCGMFFDPPYAVEDRDKNIYHNDSITVGKDVEKWCLSRGNDPKMRIVVAGYKEEYKNLVDAGWKTQSWSAQGGYSNLADSSSDAIGKTNRHRETLFFSPHCVKTELF